jgi:ATP-dependent exoDNAse (exonuclease V) beta subunit
VFEQVAWADDGDAEAVARAWTEASALGADEKERVTDAFLKVMASEEARAVLRRPSASARLWRERSFEVVLGEEWVTGMFDRVTLECDDRGRVERATILDYKTNEIEGPEALEATGAHYRPQLLLYRRALARMLDLDPACIRMLLLFTRPCRVYEVDD